MSKDNENINSNVIKDLTDKIKDLSESTAKSGKRFADGVGDAFRAQFADSPLVGSIVDLGQSLGKDVLGAMKASLFQSKEDKAADETKKLGKEQQSQNVITGKERKALKDELKEVTRSIESGINGDVALAELQLSDNEQIIDHLKDIKEVWGAGDNAEAARESARREEYMADLQEKQNSLLANLAEKKDEDDSSGSLWDTIKDNLVLTFSRLIAIFANPMGKLFTPLMKGIKFLGRGLKFLMKPLFILTAAFGAFEGFNKATEIFGENATMFEKISSAIAGAISGLTFGLIDIEPLARGVKLLGELFYDGFDFLVKLFTGTPSEIDAAFDKLTDSFMNIASNIWEAFTLAGESIMKVTSEIGTWIGTKIADMVDSIVTWVSDGISGLFQSLMDNIISLISNIPGIGGNLLKSLGFEEDEVKLAKDRIVAKDKSYIDSGEAIYDKLDASGQLNNAYFGSDTMTNGEVSKLSNEENRQLKKYLLDNNNADNNSKIIKQLNDQYKLNNTNGRNNSNNQTNINAPSNMNVNANTYNTMKPTSRTADSTFIAIAE